MKAVGKSGTVNRSGLQDTVLDPALAGKTIAVKVDKLIPTGVFASEDTRICKCRIDSSFRQGLRRDSAGRLIMTPILRAADNLVSAAKSGEARQVRNATLDFQRTRCQEMAKEFEKVAKTRNAHSAMLVGVGQYNDDMFTGDNYLSGNIGTLKPWQIGLSKKTIEKLDLAQHAYAILSRYPTTMIIVVEVTMVNEGSDDVVYLPVGKVEVAGKITSITDLLDGDLDGDQYVIRTVKSCNARAEIGEAFRAFWSEAKPVPIGRTTFSWKDHEEKHENPEEIGYQKILSKSAIGSITLDFYAVFVHLMNLQAAGVETELNFEDIRQLMTDSLEAVFDLKHSNGADPMTLHAMMLGMVAFDEARPSLEVQGLDVSKIGRLAGLLGGRSIRDLAEANLPFAIGYGSTDFNAVQRFINSAPPYRPLEFIAAVIVAQRLKSRLSYDLLLHSAKSARTLAQVYRDRLFPTL